MPCTMVTMWMHSFFIVKVLRPPGWPAALPRTTQQSHSRDGVPTLPHRRDHVLPRQGLATAQQPESPRGSHQRVAVDSTERTATPETVFHLAALETVHQPETHEVHHRHRHRPRSETPVHGLPVAVQDRNRREQQERPETNRLDKDFSVSIQYRVRAERRACDAFPVDAGEFDLV